MNPANAKFVCGGECGIAVVGTLSAGTEHWSAVTAPVAGASVSIVTSGPATMRSTRCFRFVASSGTSAQNITHTFASAISSGGTIVGRLYIYFTTLPTGNTGLVTLTGSLGTFFAATFDSVSGQIRAGGGTASGVSVTTGQWYRVDYKVAATATRLSDLSVDGVNATQESVVSSATTITTVSFGSNQARNYDLYMDDMVASTSSGDYPIGVGTTVGLYPNGDRTNTTSPGDGNFGHFYNNTTDFQKGAGAGTALGAQNVESTSWQSLQNPLSTTIPTNFVGGIGNLSTEWLVWSHDNMPTDALSINGVAATITTHSASATTNNLFVSLQDSSGIVTAGAIANADLSEATITVPYLVKTTNPNSQAWTVALVNDSFFRFTSSDVNPDVYMDGICLEVDYTPVDPLTWRNIINLSNHEAIQRSSRW